jgi:hypothetical protein
MTGTNCDLFTHKSSRSYLNHLVHMYTHVQIHTSLMGLKSVLVVCDHMTVTVGVIANSRS